MTQSAPAPSTKKVNPLLKFSSESLTAASHQRLLNTDNKSLAAVYQNILKEKWDSLSSDEQAGWNERAEAQAGNMHQ